MNSVLSYFKSVRLFERIFLGLTLISVILQYVFSFFYKVEIVVFTGVLAICYFPLGFHNIGRSSNDTSYITPILLGFVYSIGMVTTWYSMLNVEGYQYLTFFTLFLFTIPSIVLFIKLKTGSFTKEYIYAQFFRISYIIAINLVIMFNRSK